MKKIIILLLFFIPFIALGQFTISDNDNTIVVSGSGETYSFAKSSLTLKNIAGRLVFSTDKKYSFKFENISSPSYSTIDSLYDVVNGYLAYNNITADTIVSDSLYSSFVVADSIIKVDSFRFIRISDTLCIIKNTDSLRLFPSR